MKQHTRSNQQGVISIMITIIMMMVISLIILGLAQISRREVRQATDAQLSAQAFYAAESGIADVVAITKQNGSASEKHDCEPDPSVGDYADLEPVLSDGVSYTCVIVDSNLSSAPANIGSNPVVQSLRTDVNVSSFNFSWTPTSPTGPVNVANCPASIPPAPISNLFPANPASWTCPFAMLRIELASAASLNRASLQSSARSVFAVPLRSGGGSVGTGSPSVIGGATCSNATKKCSITVSVPAGKEYFMRLSGIYGTGKLTVSVGGGAHYRDIVAVDVTGKAQDVLRRVKATVDITGGNQNASAGAAIISGDSICKRFRLGDAGSIDADPCAAP